MSFDRQTFPWLWTGLVGTVGTLVVALGYIPRDRPDALAQTAVVFLATLTTGLGSIITIRQPKNEIGWLLHATSLVLMIQVTTSLVAEAPTPPATPTPLHFAAIVLFNVTSNVLVLPVLLILFVFPTGRFLSRRWTWAGWLAGVFTATLLVVALLSDEIGKIFEPDPSKPLWRLSNPIGVLRPGIGELMVSLSVALSMLLAVGGVVAMVIRYRRSDAVVRTQIKWVLYAAALAAVALMSISFSGGSEVVYALLVMAALTGVAVATTLAVVRYKLFEIDKVISRTIAYALVVGLLAAMYFGLTTLVANLLPAQGGLAVAGSTLAVAAFFNPLRKRIQGVVDRKFNRSRYEAGLVVERLSDVLSEPKSVSEITEIWRKTVGASLQPEAAGIWLNAAPATGANGAGQRVDGA